MATKFTKIIRKAEALGWDCSARPNENYVEFYKASPAGEDFGFTACGKTNKELAEDIRSYAESFDEEEHISMWLEARRNGVAGVPSVKELVEDAEDIQEMLDELAKEVA